MRPVLGLIAVVAAALLVRALLAPPDYGRRPRLAAVVDGGTMEEFLETPAERQAILEWVEAGAPEENWPEIRRLLEARCTSCHPSDASFDVLPLDRYRPAARAAEVRPVLEEKITGGTMGEYLETRDEQTVLLAWIDAGAPETGWPEAERVLDAHCVHCHNPEGVQGIVSLELYPTARRLATLPEPAPRPLAFPAVILALAVIALVAHARYRRTAGSTHRSVATR